MSETRVVNLRHESFDVYIGREERSYRLPRSLWHNPFMIGRDGTRNEVIAKYRDYLTSSYLRARVEELRGKRLGCWCKPSACHGDVLVEMLALKEVDVEVVTSAQNSVSGTAVS